MNLEEIEHKQEVLRALKKRLRERDLQLASLGISADPIIKIEIREIKSEISHIEQEIADVYEYNNTITKNTGKSTTKLTFYIFKLPIATLVITKTIEVLFYVIMAGSIMSLLGITALTMTGNLPYLPNIEQTTPENPFLRLVLDPDDNVASARRSNMQVEELNYNLILADQIRQRFKKDNCQVDILITRETVNQEFVSRITRAEAASNFESDVFVTLGFNALNGESWGSENDGGVSVWARSNHSSDDELASKISSYIQQYTGRPSTGPIHHPQIYPEFESIPGDYAHVEVLFLDHNFDKIIIDTNFSLVVDAAYIGLRTHLESNGMTCAESS